jgi:hypothetical protein
LYGIPMLCDFGRIVWSLRTQVNTRFEDRLLRSL